MFIGCDSKNSSDCFQRSGSSVKKTIAVPSFNRILVNPNVEMILKEGEETSVNIETGDNLLDEIAVKVEKDRLILSNTNDCNFVRSFNQTKVYVTAPKITEIRSATQFDISSDGVLKYPNLVLLSENHTEKGGNTTGTFHLELDSESVSVVGNNIASFFLKGKTKLLNIGFVAGLGRFEGADLLADDVIIFHRGANKVIVNPLQSIKGEIRATGDIVSVHKPLLVDVKSFFTGKLTFK